MYVCIYALHTQVRRGGVARTAHQAKIGGLWEVFARDGRLPDSGWAYLETRDDEPFRLDVENKHFDSNFWIQKTPGPIPKQGVDGEVGRGGPLPGRAGMQQGAGRPSSSSSSSSSSGWPSEY